MLIVLHKSILSVNNINFERLQHIIPNLTTSSIFSFILDIVCLTTLTMDIDTQ